MDLNFPYFMHQNNPKRKEWLSFKSEEDDRDSTGDGEMVIIRYYTNESEATFVSSYLDARGVPNFLSNRFFNQLFPIGNSEISLHVKEFQRDKAERILMELETDQDLDQQSMSSSDTLLLLEGNPDKNYKMFRDPWVILLLIILGLVLLFQMVIAPITGYKLW
jgi:hypothetical protein